MISRTRCKKLKNHALCYSRGNDQDYKKFLAETLGKHDPNFLSKGKYKDSDPFVDRIKFVDNTGVQETSSKTLNSGSGIIPANPPK